MLRVVLADHHQQALWALKILLHEEPDLELIGEALDVESLFALVGENNTDLVLVDRDLPGGFIKDLISYLHTLAPRPMVIVMSSSSQDSRLMLRAGADAFVSKGDKPEWLLETVRHFKRY